MIPGLMFFARIAGKQKQEKAGGNIALNTGLNPNFLFKGGI